MTDYTQKYYKFLLFCHETTYFFSFLFEENKFLIDFKPLLKVVFIDPPIFLAVDTIFLPTVLIADGTVLVTNVLTEDATFFAVFTTGCITVSFIIFNVCITGTTTFFANFFTTVAPIQSVIFIISIGINISRDLC